MINKFYSKVIFFTLILIISIKVLKNKNNIYEKKHIRIMRETAGECTLFLNKNNEFPINGPCNVLLIGSGARNTIKGGLGSADVESRFYTTCEEGLEKAGFKITSKNWLNQYPLLKEKKIQEHINYIKKIHKINRVNNTFRMVAFPEYDYNLKIDKDAENESDIAIYVLARNSGEGIDRRLIKGDALLTDTEIKDILYLNQKFKKFILVLNVGGVVDLSPVSEVSNILLLSQLGVVTGDILSDIILGKVNPSGKLTTTWAKIDDYKFIKEFGDPNDTYYKDGVYVGYRYFDSAGIKPLYPFGLGLSYTTFYISKISLTNKKEEISIKIRVKNVGQFPGKEVIQVYISPSQENIDKPYQSLVTFGKTPKLKPKKEVKMTLKFKLRNVARYNEQTASFVLDKGIYIIRVGNSSKNTQIYGYIKLIDNVILEELTNLVGTKDFEDYKPSLVLKDDLSNVQKIELSKEDFGVKKIIKYNYEYKVYDKISKLNNSDLAYLCVGSFITDEKEINEKQRGLNALTTKKVKDIKKYLKMADGPSGLRIAKVYKTDPKGHKIKRLSPNPGTIYSYSYLSKRKKISLHNDNKNKDYSNFTNVFYQYATAIPIGTALAQTFNLNLVEKYGKVIGKEMELYDIDILLGPSLNIHRNILCGRNFEYYSEDPLISGKMASAFVRGVQSHKNKGTTLKHFAANNQELNRLNSNSIVSERALREIYLKGFQIAIEESQPTALMTSDNLINGLHPSENEQLIIDVVRNEWKFQGLIMTDWTRSGQMDFETSKNPPQYVYNTLKSGINIMMPGNQIDYDLILEKLKEKVLTRDDLLCCASKVFETLEHLNE